ncbi:MAG: hypothetical protein JAY88_12970 [Candidatus Thiodiazotropha lotti]|nr:hypothetical protein [Candidatus Thiodiazotropha lotti]MCW4187977.1 hypothetical protein [Candidatus Thiodiazotropha lotti]
MANETLTVGVIQTSLDANAAWQSLDDVGGDWTKCVQMSELEERRAKKEIRHFLASFKGVENHADIVLLPELSVPIGYERRLSSIAEEMQTIIIAGLDYQIEKEVLEPTVSNEAVIIVPRKLNGEKILRQTETRRIGKTYPAPAEKLKLYNIGKDSKIFSERPVNFRPHPTIWLFDSGMLGKFAVAVCYDFLDLDRIALYRNKIQTLFILAYNRDTNSFDHVAESISRTVFCNVVVCNCGHFGGSIAICPFREPYKRTVYHHSGQELTNAQLIQLPLKSLIDHQLSGNNTKEYKSLPPGFTTPLALDVRSESIPHSKRKCGK